MNRSLSVTVLASLGCASHIASHQLPRLSTFPDPSPLTCTPIDPRTVGRVDVVIAIDASRSSSDMTGLDINGNGRVGEPRLVRRLNVFDVTYTDPGDSLFAAEVVAARSLVRRAAGDQVRFSIVSFTGADAESKQAPPSPPTDHSTIEVGPTADVRSLEDALSRVLERGSGRMTDFTAGMRAATKALENAQQTSVRRVVFFMSDSTFPSVVGPDLAIRFDDPSMKEAALEAIAAGIAFHTFRLGNEPQPGSRAHGLPDYLKHIAGATGGTYTGVTELDQLHCALARALAP